MASGGVAGILAAGGSGDRASDPSDPTPKQFRALRDRPLWRWAYDVLERACDEVICVVPERYLDELSSIGIRCVAGGATRQASVLAGLRAIEADTVLVHDAARPLVSDALVQRVLVALEGVDGATAAIPLRDTTVRVQHDRISDFIDRGSAWRVQTPQAFPRVVLQEAHQRALASAVSDASDDAQLVRASGGEVSVVRGDERNMKITDPGDWLLAEALLERAR